MWLQIDLTVPQEEVTAKLCPIQCTLGTRSQHWHVRHDRQPLALYESNVHSLTDVHNVQYCCCEELQKFLELSD